MSERMLMKGNEVIAEAAIRAGCRHYFGYPITPQTEIAHYMAKKMPQIGGTFVQAESEVAAINMVYGAAGAGARAMTSSSSPGISLKQEGLSYMACAELPAVVVNIMRCGPGLGGIMAAQADYFQAVKGGGHGDYRLVVLAPNSVQELYELTVEAFNIADRYRVVAMILGDGMLGQMMEAVEFRDEEDIRRYDKGWATTGTQLARPRNVITSIDTVPERLEAVNNRLQARYREIEANETRVEAINCEGADVVVTAFGMVSRIVRNVMADAEREGVRIGLVRPVTLWPFPSEAVRERAADAKAVLSVELNAGQMVEDVRLAIEGAKPVHFLGRTGGMAPSQREIARKIKDILGRAS
ncbi:MAG: 3-methyl-2-oxobutanoate dehydrogenase subunit VorB [Clostridiales bacterium]|jgi:2-oxoglutarate ferredoxin oxidoreductase subunit alpha|nr:3-methyl-2-oxobutanoate dehydrogenase subunit VorB [Clostridiales bacterium]